MPRGVLEFPESSPGSHSRPAALVSPPRPHGRHAPPWTPLPSPHRTPLLAPLGRPQDRTGARPHVPRDRRPARQAQRAILGGDKPSTRTGQMASHPADTCSRAGGHRWRWKPGSAFRLRGGPAGPQLPGSARPGPSWGLASLSPPGDDAEGAESPLEPLPVLRWPGLDAAGACGANSELLGLLRGCWWPGSACGPGASTPLPGLWPGPAGGRPVATLRHTERPLKPPVLPTAQAGRAQTFLRAAAHLHRSQVTLQGLTRLPGKAVSSRGWGQSRLPSAQGLPEPEDRQPRLEQALPEPSCWGHHVAWDPPRSAHVRAGTRSLLHQPMVALAGKRLPDLRLPLSCPG